MAGRHVERGSTIEWTRIETPSGFAATNIASSEDGTLFVSGRYTDRHADTLLRRPRDRADWQDVTPPHLGHLFDVQVTRLGDVWVGGGRREVHHLVDGLWITELTPHPYHNEQIQMFEDGTGWVIGRTRGLSALYHRYEGHWTTVHHQVGGDGQGKHELNLVFAERKAAVVETRDGIRVFAAPGFPPPDDDDVAWLRTPGTIQVTGLYSGWRLHRGTIERFHDGTWHAVDIQGNPDGISHVLAGRDGGLYGVGETGLYLLGPWTPSPPVARFDLARLDNAWPSGRIRGIAVLRVRGSELLYVVDHDEWNVALGFGGPDFGIEPTDARIWRSMTEQLGLVGPGAIENWEPPYDVGAVCADLDGNGHEDILLVSMYDGCRLLLGSRSGSFVDATERSGVRGGPRDHSVGAALLDAEGDGDLDLYICNTLVPDRLLVNDGAAVFRDVSVLAGVKSLDSSQTAIACDLDRDGDTDIAVATWGRGILIHENISRDGEPRFLPHYLRLDGTSTGSRPTLSRPFVNSLATADFDGDGLPDLFACAQVGPDRLLWNRGGLSWEPSNDIPKAATAYAPSYGANPLDLDDDGDLDLVVAGAGGVRFYENAGGTFTPRGASASDGEADLVVVTGSAVLDFDDDGDLDLVVGTDGRGITTYRNDTPSARSIVVDVVGPPANRSAVGAQITVTRSAALATSRAEPAAPARWTQIGATSGYGSSDTRRAFFTGLDLDHRYDVHVALPGARPIVREGVPCPSQVTATLDGSGPFGWSGSVGYRASIFLHDPSHRRWTVLTVLGMIGSVVAVSILLRPTHQARPIHFAPVLLACASVALYATLPDTLGRARSIVPPAASLTLVLGILGGWRLRASATAIPELMASLSDGLQALGHNEEPRRALVGLRFLLENLEPAEGLTQEKARALHRDVSDYARATLPQLSSIVRLADTVGLGRPSTSAAMAKQQRIVAQLLGDRGLAAGPAAPVLFELRQAIVDLENWIPYVRESVDRRLSLPVRSSVEAFVNARTSRSRTRVDVTGDVHGELRARFLSSDFDRILDTMWDNAQTAMQDDADPRIAIHISNAFDLVVLDFQDTGQGVPASTRGRLFERGVTSKKGTGHGTGLYDAARIARRYGGRITLVEESPGGARFRLEMHRLTIDEEVVPHELIPCPRHR
jgi:signal transduction histidine kinase